VEIMTENQLVLWGCIAAMLAYLIYETFIAKPRNPSKKDEHKQ